LALSLRPISVFRQLAKYRNSIMDCYADPSAGFISVSFQGLIRNGMLKQIQHDIMKSFCNIIFSLYS